MSCEHDISIITGLQAMSACGRDNIGVYIDECGVWWTSDGFDSVNAVKNKRFKGKRVHIRAGEPFLYCKNKRLCKIDTALLCMHGMLGEDGALQGLLEMSGIAYTGSGILASAVGMDKLCSKKIFKAAGLKVAPYVALSRATYEKDVSTALKPIKTKLGYPVIVKPCNLGSSIGISVAKTQDELYTALRVAFEWDDVVIVEKAIENFTEINCAVIGDGPFDDFLGGEADPSDTEQPVGWESFLTFSDKYAGDVKATRHKIPADVSDEINDKIKSLAVKAYKAVGCCGVARIDFLVSGEDIYVNEINTIPGSLSNALFKSEIDFTKLIDLLLDRAVRRKKRFDALKRTYTPVDPIIAK